MRCSPAMVVLGALLSLAASAADEPAPEGELVLKVRNSQTRYIQAPGSGAQVSESCRHKHFQCDAAKAVGKAAQQRLGQELLEGGKNPAAVICQALKGRPLRGRDELRNEHGVCLFRDGSSVLTDSLVAAAAK